MKKFLTEILTITLLFDMKPFTLLDIKVYEDVLPSFSGFSGPFSFATGVFSEEVISKYSSRMDQWKMYVC